jgi:ABC-type bacteriocin/lantibiotic exporter with double-glycine peptidase domain
MDAPILRIITQRHPMDCVVACLAMLLGVSYENALVAVAQDEPNVCVKGIGVRQMERAAKRLGYRLKARRHFDLESDTGILNVKMTTMPHDHLVILKSGLVFETDATVWDADVFAATHRAQLNVLYVAESADGLSREQVERELRKGRR